MKDQTINEAVGFIETAAKTIKKAVADLPAQDGITLEQFLHMIPETRKANVTAKVRWNGVGTVWNTWLDRMSVEGNAFVKRIPAEWPVLSAHIDTIGLTIDSDGNAAFIANLKEEILWEEMR